MGALPESFIDLDGVRVDRRLFTTRFICDVVLQDCHSACCHRGCITTTAEVDRLTPHMRGITEYLPEAKREFLRQEGGRFMADPAHQDPDIALEEGWAMIRFFQSVDEMRCTWIHDDGCVFLYPASQAAAGRHETVTVQYCAIHSYAMDQGMDWQTFKQTDCVQYPLCIYTQDGRTVLALQEEPGHARVPCLNNPMGPPMYRSLSGTITYLLGEAFNERVQAYGSTHFPD